jgi:tRNA(Ile)-lysidine synthase
MLDRLTIERMAADDGPVLIALSGGGDSTALLHLLVERLGAARLQAAIVDHALREGSADDARRAAGFAEAAGVRAHVLTLTWPGGARRAQAAAREARFRALCEAARNIGAQVIVMAHTADDQAETVLMRAAGGSTWRGLAGMAPIAPAPVWPEGRGVLIARPLLGARRTVLRQYLLAKKSPWIEDPANANPAFERVRIRARLAAMEAEGLDPMRFARLAARLRTRADALDGEARELIGRAARFNADCVHISRIAWTGGLEARRRALSALITAAAGAAREPEPSGVARLEARLADEKFRGATLGGATFELNGAMVLLSRDLGALLGRAGGGSSAAPLALKAGVEAVWDGRLAITAVDPDWTVRADRRGRPRLTRGESDLDLRECEGEGVVRARWLLADRVDALLGAPHSDRLR